MPKSVFLEVSPNADLDSAATIAYIALGNLTFSKRAQAEDIKVIGIRIESDSYEFFKLEENTQSIRSEVLNRNSAKQDNRLAGEVIWYNSEKGYGSIYCPSLNEEFYIHIYKTDNVLSNTLKALDVTGTCEPPIPVTFTDGGYKEGHPKRQAQYASAA